MERRKPMTISPLAGKPAPKEMLVDPARLAHLILIEAPSSAYHRGMLNWEKLSLRRFLKKNIHIQDVGAGLIQMSY
jgi:hypothetical protein